MRRCGSDGQPPARSVLLAARADGITPVWPWDDRGRSAVTADSVRGDLVQLGVVVAQVMEPAQGNEVPAVRINGEGWV